jgi:SagB-type dehydrogenase family enzyme
VSRNARTELARAYHEATAHSPRSVRSSGHRLDWGLKPGPFKIYPDLTPVPLPRELPALGRETLAALRGEVQDAAPLDLERLAAILFFSAGITKRHRYPGGETFFFRAAASTGALYQTEVYVVAGAVAGLPAGVYHFCPGDFALRCLREGDFRGALVEAGAPAIARCPAALVLTAIYWRNAWKYEARAYRHLFWDSGTMLANALASAAGCDVPAALIAGFVDARMNHLLGLDPSREGALEIVALGGEGAPAPPSPAPEPLRHRTIALSASEVEYPALLEAYDASSLETVEEVETWRRRGASPGAASLAGQASRPRGVSEPLPSPSREAGRVLGETIQARGSTREFSGGAIAAGALSTALYHATRGVPADFPSGLVDLYLNIHAVEGIAPGAYWYDAGAHALERLKGGDLRRDSSFLCLEQPLGGRSSATVFFLADLGRLLERFGNRGYRLANLEAGLIGGRLYLAAYAQRFGASGLTFYDRPVAAFFAPHAEGREAIFVTALGRSARRHRATPVERPLTPLAD